MTDVVLVALIAAVPSTLVAVGSLVVGLSNRTKLTEVHQQVDGKMEQLLDLTRTSSYREGKQDEKDSSDST